jgi:hypothetical protein
MTKEISMWLAVAFVGAALTGVLLTCHERSKTRCGPYRIMQSDSMDALCDYRSERIMLLRSNQKPDMVFDWKPTPTPPKPVTGAQPPPQGGGQ